MTLTPASIDFTVGSRRLLAVPRRLETVCFSLEDILAGRLPKACDRQEGDGFRVLSAPQERIGELLRHFPDHVMGGRQDYPRHYIDMSGSYEDYLGQFSGKTRSTLRRKQRKLADACDGACRVSAHRTVAEVEDFLKAALPLSAMTYQARLLDAGLPDTPRARERLLEQAEQDRLRCFLLRAGDTPIAYLALPIDGQTLVYAWLGYQPEWARLSPGTVLQMEALEQLFAEARYRWFDFTEGDGAHKAMFGTASVECASFVLLEKTLANRALLGARDGFDAAVAGAKSIAERSGALARVRTLLRA
ncbi:GNAT family N-acetyltransferase [Altererythrobacter arenosus]|uniref:GNAT family N-acetyltransferase n=1 Tax=Altererythrobacter arenosus TaxID=3032592 RepID=A0ABY8FTZ2_9SPHN|nr:GNAT family N-acetyltransferase [Altererythrobacter sp. CAU 1644]WFL78232.1 GNAT family N-acetyltransferase [Altererythrobacter sp. CAU 1644]